MTSKRSIWRTTSKFRHSTDLIINENSIVYKHLSSTKGIRASGLYAHFVEYHRVDFGMQSSNNLLSSSAHFAGRKTLFDGCIFQTKPNRKPGFAVAKSTVKGLCLCLLLHTLTRKSYLICMLNNTYSIYVNSRLTAFVLQ